MIKKRMKKGTNGGGGEISKNYQTIYRSSVKIVKTHKHKVKVM